MNATAYKVIKRDVIAHINADSATARMLYEAQSEFDLDVQANHAAVAQLQTTSAYFAARAIKARIGLIDHADPLVWKEE